MATGKTVSVEMRGLGKFRNVIHRVAKGMGARAELHERFGLQAVNWIQRNFSTEGAHSGAPWAKLSPNTILGRRGGGRGAKILRDTGQLAQSFVMEFGPDNATVGTAKKYAAYHEKGGTRSYPIRPKNAKVLAFAHAQGKPLEKAVLFRSTERKMPKGTPIMYAREVTHPPLPARPMLPTARNFLPVMQRVAANFLKELERRGERIAPDS